MITNERQYRITKRKERSFCEAIKRFDAQGSGPSDVHPRIRQAEREAMESQLVDLRAEIAEYEGEGLEAADLAVISTATSKLESSGPQPAGAGPAPRRQGAANPAVRD